MSKIAVVYWSGTGNTEAMAKAVLRGAQNKGASAELFEASAFDAGKLASLDAVAFGCPAMGSKALEDGEFEPMFEDCKPALNGKTIALFGSYGWGDGEWMRMWEDEAKGAGAELAVDSVIVNGAPDDEGEADCKALGAALA